MPTAEQTHVRSVYLTFPDVDSALSTARTLVEERLVACVNVLPRATSVYRWEEKVVSEEEVVAFAKTTADKVPAVVDRVGELHPYDVPCVVALAVTGGAAPYLEWVGEETS